MERDILTISSQAVKCCSSLTVTLSTIWKWEDICRIGISWVFYFEPSGLWAFVWLTRGEFDFVQDFPCL